MKKVTMSFPLRLYLYVLLYTVLIFGCITVVFSSYGRKREEKVAVLYTSALQCNLLQKINDELLNVEPSASLAVKHLVSTPDFDDSELVNFMSLPIENNPSILDAGFVSIQEEHNTQQLLR